MDFLQKCDASNRLSSNRNTSQNSFRPVSQADRTNSSLIEPDGTKVKRLTFAEDFMLEHSHSGQHTQRAETVSPIFWVSFLTNHNSICRRPLAEVRSR